MKTPVACLQSVCPSFPAACSSRIPALTSSSVVWAGDPSGHAHRPPAAAVCDQFGHACAAPPAGLCTLRYTRLPAACASTVYATVHCPATERYRPPPPHRRPRVVPRVGWRCRPELHFSPRPLYMYVCDHVGRALITHKMWS
eukprot:scaffold13712_cov124-Isochrysis_galbana.AAC.7